MSNTEDHSCHTAFGKKYFKPILILGVIAAIAVLMMPLIGNPGIADPKTATTGGLWINFLGRFHPLILHLPIGAFVLISCMEGLGVLSFGKYKPKVLLALAFAALTSIAAVTLGYFWYLNGSYEGDSIEAHKRDGIIFTILMIATFLAKFSGEVKDCKPLKRIYLPLLALTGISMMSAGHHGGDMVHGDPLNQLPSKILAKRAEKENEVITDPVIYKNIVHNILDNKCISCHGEDKQNGSLRMDSMVAMLKGGATEDCLVPGDTKKSFMLTSLDLPLDDDLHMPPKNKTQITPEEKAILTWWVEIGAPEETKLSEVDVPENILAAIDTLITPEERERRRIAKEKAEAERLAQIKQTRERIQKHWEEVNKKFPGSLRYISQKDTNLSFSIVSYRDTFTDGDLALLAEIAPDISSLDLSSSSVGDSGIKELTNFTKLKTLKINETKVTDKALEIIAGLPALERLNLYSTAITDAGLEPLKAHPSLKKIYLWDTKVTPAAANTLQEALRERDKLMATDGEEAENATKDGANKTKSAPAKKKADQPKTQKTENKGNLSEVILGKSDPPAATQ